MKPRIRLKAIANHEGTVLDVHAGPGYSNPLYTVREDSGNLAYLHEDEIVFLKQRMQYPDENGKDCTDHSYAWTGKIPCTGVRKCRLCGKVDYQESSGVLGPSLTLPR